MGSLSIELMALRKRMVETLNVSPLPPCVKVMVLKEVYDSMKELAEREYYYSIQEANKGEEGSEGNDSDDRIGCEKQRSDKEDERSAV